MLFLDFFKKAFLALTILALSIAPSFAIQETEKISLKDAVEFALKTNPQIKLSELDVLIAKNEIEKANRLQNPSLETFQNIPKAGIGNPQQIGVGYTLEILKRKKRQELAKTYYKLTDNYKNFAKHIFISEVKKSYIALLVKKTNFKILKEQENLAREEFMAIKKEVDSKKLPETELIQAKILLNRSMLYSNVARSEVISAQNYFNTVLNSGEMSYDTLEEDFPEDFSKLLVISPKNDSLNFEDIKKIALENRFDLLAARKNIQKSKDELELVKANRIPDLEIMGGYSYVSKGMSENGKFQNGGYIGANLINIPVLYNYTPEIKNAEIEIEKAELKYKDTEIDALRNIADAWEKYVISKNNLNFYTEELLKNSKELMQASKNNLRDKKIDLTTFLVSKRLFLETILGYHEALGEYCTSYTDLLKELNVDNIETENI